MRFRECVYRDLELRNEPFTTMTTIFVRQTSMTQARTSSIGAATGLPRRRKSSKSRHVDENILLLGYMIRLQMHKGVMHRKCPFSTPTRHGDISSYFSNLQDNCSWSQNKIAFSEAPQIAGRYDLSKPNFAYSEVFGAHKIFHDQVSQPILAKIMTLLFSYL